MTKLKDQIMDKVNKGSVKMKPKEFFTALKILTAILILAVLGTAAFLFNLSLYVPRRNLGGRYMLGSFLSNVPWTYVVLALVLLFVGIFILEKKTTLYKKRTVYVVLGIVLAVLFSGFILSNSKINHRLEKRPGWKNFYQDPIKRGPKRMNYNIHFER